MSYTQLLIKFLKCEFVDIYILINFFKIKKNLKFVKEKLRLCNF